MVITFFILTSCIFDHVPIMEGEVLLWSLWTDRANVVSPQVESVFEKPAEEKPEEEQSTFASMFRVLSS